MQGFPAHRLQLQGLSDSVFLARLDRVSKLKFLQARPLGRWPETRCTCACWLRHWWHFLRRAFDMFCLHAGGEHEEVQ